MPLLLISLPRSLPAMCGRLLTRPGALALLIGSACISSACGDNTAPVAVGAVEIIAPVTNLDEGSTYVFTAVAKSSWGVALTDRPISWSSRDHSVATVSTTGVVTAVGGGITEIVAGSGGQSSRVAVRVTARRPVPVLLAVEPASFPLDTPSTIDLIVRGDGFSENSVIYWNAIPRLTAFVSPRELRTTVSPQLADVAGPLSVEVRTPAPGGGTTAPQWLTILQPTPVITSLDPDRITIGAVFPVSVSVNGSGFTARSRLFVDGHARAIDGFTQTVITFRLDPWELTLVGQLRVRVENPAPRGGSAESVFLVRPAPIPQPAPASR